MRRATERDPLAGARHFEARICTIYDFTRGLRLSLLQRNYQPVLAQQASPADNGSRDLLEFATLRRRSSTLQLKDTTLAAVSETGIRVKLNIGKQHGTDMIRVFVRDFDCARLRAPAKMWSSLTGPTEK
jgi:hypothetical protein